MARVVNPSMVGIWIKKDVAAIPVLACMGVAVGWCGYMSARHLFSCPDVSILPGRRAQILKDREDPGRSGEVWWKSHNKWTAVDHSKIRIFSSFETKKN